MYKKILVVLQISILALIGCFILSNEAYASPNHIYNARVKGDFFYLRDSNGNIIPGQINDGSIIAVIDVSYSKQLVLVKYFDENSKTERVDYIKNVPSLIKYEYQDMYKNGSTKEIVYDQDNNPIGSLDPWERATPLYADGDKLYIVYNTSKGKNTKSGYVKYWGGVVELKDCDCH